MECASPVDLRARLDPPVPAAATTNMAYPHACLLPVTGDAGSVASLATSVKSDLERSIEQGSILSSFAESFTVNNFSEPPDVCEKQDLTKLIVSNLGLVKDFTAASDLKIVDFQMWTHNWHGTPGVVYVVYTYREACRIQFVYKDDLFQVGQIDAIAEFVRGILLSS